MMSINWYHSDGNDRYRSFFVDPSKSHRSSLRSNRHAEFQVLGKEPSTVLWPHQDQVRGNYKNVNNTP